MGKPYIQPLNLIPPPPKPKHPGGRPSKYDDAFVQVVHDYLQTCGPEQRRLPKRCDVALTIGVDDNTINAWANAKDEGGNLIHPEFFSALRALDDMQKAVLMDAGIFGGRDINPAIVALLLQANHGMVRTDKTILAGGRDEALQVQIIEDVELGQERGQLPAARSQADQTEEQRQPDNQPELPMPLGAVGAEPPPKIPDPAPLPPVRPEDVTIQIDDFAIDAVEAADHEN